MKNEHTPGPWRLYLASGDAVYPGIDANGDTIVIYGVAGEQCGIRGGTSEVRLANARLIAAAPDLLSALKDVIETIELPSYGDDNPLDDLYADGGFSSFGEISLIEAAKRAIAKATGDVREGLVASVEGEK